VVDVVEKIFEMPMSGWSEDTNLRRVGAYMSTSLCEGIRGLAWQAYRALGLSPEEIEELVAQIQQDCANPSIHVYLKL